MTQISPKRIRDAATEPNFKAAKEKKEEKSFWQLNARQNEKSKKTIYGWWRYSLSLGSVLSLPELNDRTRIIGMVGGGVGGGVEREIPKRTRVSSREDWLASETAAALWTMVLWRGQWARPLDLQDWQTETRQPDFKPRQRSFKPISKGCYTILWLFYTFPGYQTGKIKLSAIGNSVYFKVWGNFLRNQSYSTAIKAAPSITPSLTPKHVFVGFSKLYTCYVRILLKCCRFFCLVMNG